MTPPQTVRQWLTRQDGLDSLSMGETGCPTPGEDEVLVEIHSVSLNYRDTEGTSAMLRSMELLPNVHFSLHGRIQPP